MPLSALFFPQLGLLARPFLKDILFLLKIFLIHLTESERQRNKGSGRGRSRLLPSREPEAGLEPGAGLETRSVETMTWARGGCLTSWDTQMPLNDLIFMQSTVQILPDRALSIWWENIEDMGTWGQTPPSRQIGFGPGHCGGAGSSHTSQLGTGEWEDWPQQEADILSHCEILLIDLPATAAGLDSAWWGTFVTCTEK